jgi:phage/plasmid primase-like uncharacterized protein
MPEISTDFSSSARLLKSQITLAQVIESYGIRVTGKLLPCPLHHETKPSMKLYGPETFDGSFYCFGCRRHGDIINFVAFMDNCTPGQAMGRLSRLFSIKMATREDVKSTLVSNLTALLSKKASKPSKDVTELLHWQVLAERASREFEALGSDDVPYLIKKKLSHVGTRSKWDILIVPMRDIEGNLWSFQQIQADGTKMFLKDARKSGLMLRLGDERTDVVFLCEGWATGASVYLSTGRTTFVCFSANNLDSVAGQLKCKYPGIVTLVAGDNDEPGHCHSQPAVYPPGYKSDWSDIYITRGPEVVKSLLTGTNPVV